MNDCKSESNCLASLAVFRELYNNETDVYTIIAVFLKETIISNSKHQFTLDEITTLLNNTFDFKIPKAVVKSSLRRLKFLKRDKGYYHVTNLAEIENADFNKKQTEIQHNNDFLIKKLLGFIEEKKRIKLSDHEKEQIIHSFCSYILDKSNKQDYTEYISAFVIKNKNDINFTKQLNIIKEGVVLYYGIRYYDNLNALGAWNTRLTIFIDTEILFHFAGYNGELYKTLFNDFFSLVSEVNRKGKEKLIKLKYFTEIKREISNFFKKAEYIVKGKDKANPSSTAMNSIIDGCKTPADIILKETQFYELLKTNAIIEDDYTNYFASNNHKYNIDDLDIIDEITKTLDVKDIDEHIKLLNFINIHRKDASSNNFNNIGHILLSGNSDTLKVAQHGKIKQQGNVPLATDLNFLTNKFWFKLNKGFGSSRYPKTFDIITKAQIVLSTQINETVSIQYDEFQRRFQEGELTKEEAIATVANLREKARKPEDIKDEDINNILDSISEEGIEKYSQEREYFKNKANESEKEKKKLKKKISITELQLQEKEKNEIELIQKSIKIEDDLLQTKKVILENLMEKKEAIDKQVISEFKKYKISFSIALFTYYGMIVFFIIKLGWDVVEPWTYIFGLIPILASVLYMLIKEKSLNPIILLKSIKNKILKQKYLASNFDINKIQSLKDEITLLEKEIEDMKEKITQQVIK